MKASFKIVKRLFCLGYTYQKYHRSVRNVAMVCVAAVALGSSTYAWFVTNNKVDATTTNISAQSNAAFMTITNGASGASAVDTTSATTKISGPVKLYPATFGEQEGSTKGTFMTGYGTDLDNAKLKGNLTTVGTTGTPDEADTNSDASKWVVYGLNTAKSAYEIKLSSETDNSAPVLGSVTAGQDTVVNVYLFYEGSDTNIHTKNLQENKLDSSQSVKINFTATADNK